MFAQIVGTIVLLEEEERRRIKGTIINKFRGDKEILRPGLDMLVERTHVPVCGVVPYFYLDIDDEDSLSERFAGKQGNGPIDIAVIRFRGFRILQIWLRLNAEKKYRFVISVSQQILANRIW